MDLYTHFKRTISALDDAGIPFLVVDGIALAFYVKPRATEDIDFMILPEDNDRAKKALEPLDYQKIAPTMSFAEGLVVIERLTYVEEGETFVVDLLHAQGQPLLSIWSQKEPFEYEGRTVHVVSREGLVELKKLRGSPQDKVDVGLLENEEGEI